jgi:peptide/nickel transport system substrate-binding protein
MGHAIGTGPFRMKAYRAGETMVMERDPGYWEVDEDGNHLPFLDGVRVTFVKDKARELEQFREGNLSAIYELPFDSLNVLKDSVDATGTGVSSWVQSPGSRRSSMASIPRGRPSRMRACAVPSVWPSIATPWCAMSSKGWPSRRSMGWWLRGWQVIRTTWSPASSSTPTAPVHCSHRLVTRAVVASPPQLLQVNGDGYGYVQVADAVQAMLERELHVNVAVSVLPADQHFDRVETGQAHFWREGWIADYPDPENFLALLYGKNAVLDTSQRTFLNTTRYHDPQFDSFFALAQGTTDEVKRLRQLAQAERKAMHDAVIAPLYHDRNVRLLQPWVRDLPQNAMEYRDLSAVWFDRSTEVP